jgi:protein-tyrosine phosphatase
VRVLVICTANICRSVMAAAFLARALDRAGETATVTSAGVSALVNTPPPAEVIEVMSEHGLDVAGHRGCQLARPGTSDLVIGLTRAHVREAVVMEPTLLPSAFTLKELARRAAAAGPRPETASLSEWVATLSAGRRVDELLGDSPVDDCRDPIGQPIRVYREAAGELVQLSEEVVRLLWRSSGEAGHELGQGSDPARRIV